MLYSILILIFFFYINLFARSELKEKQINERNERKENRKYSHIKNYSFTNYIYILLYTFALLSLVRILNYFFLYLFILV